MRIRRNADYWVMLRDYDVRLEDLYKRHRSLVFAAKMASLGGAKALSLSYKPAMDAIEEEVIALTAARDVLVSNFKAWETNQATTPPAAPRLGERLLLLILLTKDERVNIPGDLEEEYRGIAAKYGARYAKLWYYKQVAASAWPMIRKAVGWGLLASVGAWLRGRL